MFIALGATMALYVALSLAVMGTLTVEEVTAAGPTALAKAAEPILGKAGYVIMVVAALLATSSTVNAGFYPANGASRDLVAKGQFPPLLAHPLGPHGTMGLLVTAGLTLVLAMLFDLSAIANLGNATALLLFLLSSAGHLRVIAETGANRALIILCIVVTAAALVYTAVTLIFPDPRTLASLVVFVAFSVGLDLVWKRMRGEQPAPVTL
jgi:amino acid transporter